MNKKSVIRRTLSGFLTGVMVFLLIAGSVFAPIVSEAATSEKDSVSRLIHVVYDDSTSMGWNGNVAWSEAKYSLEILSAMMQEKDVMNVYYMSSFQDKSFENDAIIKNLSGAESRKQNNINAIHTTKSQTNGTYFESITKAYEDLKSNGAGYDERHLVVITDGQSFSDNDNAKRDLDSLFGQNPKTGISVVYLAIGDGAIVPTASDDGKVFVYDDANPGDKSILAEVTKISERIFQRPQHPVSGDTIDLKIPVSEIVIFAQGDNVSIGDINGMKKSQASAKFTDADNDKFTTKLDFVEPYEQGIDKIKVAPGLSGSVATFTPASGDYIDAQKIELNVTASSYAVYYKPCLDVVLEIKNSDGDIVKDGSTVNIGKYTANYFLTYPEGHADHGKPVDLSGLDINPTYTVTINLDGKQVDRKMGNPTLDFDFVPGETVVTVTAEYLTYISKDKSTAFTVEDKTEYKLGLTLTPDSKDYTLSSLEDDKDGFTLKVTYDDGRALSDTAWKNCKLSLEAEGVDFFEPEKNSDHSFTIRPKLKNGKFEDTASGEIPFKATVTTEDEEGRSYKDKAEGKINIDNDVIAGENGFRVEIIKITPDKIKSGDFNDCSPKALVEITWNGKPLSRIQYDNLTVEAEMKKDLKVTDDKGNEVSLVEITEIALDPYADGDPTRATLSFVANGDAETQRTKLGSHDDFTVTAKIDMKGVVSEDSDDGTLGVKRSLSPIEIIGIILLILLILSYTPLIKGYLPFKINYKFKSAGGHMTPGVKYSYLDPIAILTTLIPGCPVFSKMDFNIMTGRSTLAFSVRFRGRPLHCTKARYLGKEDLLNNGISIGTSNLKTFKNDKRCILDLTGGSIYYNNGRIVNFTFR